MTLIPKWYWTSDIKTDVNFNEQEWFRKQILGRVFVARMMTHKSQRETSRQLVLYIQTYKEVSISAPLKEKLTFVCYKEQSRQKEGEMLQLKPNIVSCSRISRRWISSPLKNANPLDPMWNFNEHDTSSFPI